MLYQQQDRSVKPIVVEDGRLCNQQFAFLKNVSFQWLRIVNWV
jgi:hypothetical protein